MNSIKVLVIEDERGDRLRLHNLLEDLVEDEQIPAATPSPNVDKPFLISELEAEATTGKYPIAFIDLNLPHQEGAKHLNGFDFIEIVREFNPNVMIAAYTSNADLEYEKLIESVAHLMNKTHLDPELKPKIIKLFNETLKTFNYSIDVRVKEALSKAFPFGKPSRLIDSNEENWELSLRRIFKNAENNIEYDIVGSGKSGAGVVAAIQEGMVPWILKLDDYSRLVDEAIRYKKLVKDRVLRCADTNTTDKIARSGNVGVLAYSYLGIDENSNTLADAFYKTNEFSKLTHAIYRHFTNNVSKWFHPGNNNANSVKSTDVGQHYKDHFRIVPASIREECLKNQSAEAAQSAADVLEVDVVDMVEAIIDAVVCVYKKIDCKGTVTVHGDLNVNNLIWVDEYDLWLIDYAHVCKEKLRLIDFVKLECSIKYDIKTVFESGEDEVIARTLAFERWVLQLSTNHAEQIGAGLKRKLDAIGVIRECAVAQSGPNPELEYAIALLMVTVKHVQYLAEDLNCESNEESQREYFSRLVHALFSAYTLSTHPAVVKHRDIT